MPARVETRCCIAGGGPAGMMLGLLLARAGVDTVVLEKHADFLRDFRGDTVHPSTLEVMHELGVLDDFLRRPHQEIRTLRARFGDMEVTVADFSHVPTRCKFIALMPQWDFLDFIAERARRYPCFDLRMQAEVTGVIEDGGRVAGVRATTPEGPVEVHADMIVGADGRSSRVRDLAQLEVDDLGAPIDVLWLRLSRRPGDPGQLMGVFDRGRIFVMIDRGDYWQCGFVIPKGGLDALRRRGLDRFRTDIVEIAPFLHDRVAGIRDWDDVRLLTVKIDRLRRWYRSGLLCIGDAAHAMSPIGGVGINLAVQDAVAAANICARPLAERSLSIEDLRRVQRRRQLPTRIIQALQVFLQERFISRALGAEDPITPPLPVRLIRRYPFLRRVPARLVGVGLRPEHVRTPDVLGGQR
jgi:2-polyprenyl-6-methoxyphenol hydroxylase-like FAD-dependent oxidoreductase